jgi:hypothetical protein
LPAPNAEFDASRLAAARIESAVEPSWIADRSRKKLRKPVGEDEIPAPNTVRPLRPTRLLRQRRPARDLLPIARTHIQELL